MNGINKVILLGNVGNEPEVRTTQSGKLVANLSIATTEKFSDANGNKTERTEWHRIVLWGKLAEVVQKYVHKGQGLFVEGKISSREYTDKEGIKRTAFEIIAQNMQMVGGGPKGSQPQQQGQPYGQQGAAYGVQQGQQQAYGQQAPAAPAGQPQGPRIAGPSSYQGGYGQPAAQGGYAAQQGPDPLGGMQEDIPF